MKRLIITLLISIMPAAAFAKIYVVATYPYIKDITKQIGKREVRVNSLAPGNWDPHHIVPKPSHIAKLRRADLLIINGAQIEMGWLPPLLRDSGNPKILPGNSRFLDLSAAVKLIDIPVSVSRAQGDIHPAGNPHFYLDPVNIPLMARAIMKQLIEIKPDSSAFFKRNYLHFINELNRRKKSWDAKLRPLRGQGVVQYHKHFDYLLKRYGILRVATLEPLPGIPPTSRHMEKVINIMKRRGTRFILQDTFNSPRPAQFVANKTGAKVIFLPHDVYSVSGVDNIFSLYDEIVGRLTND